MIHPAGIRAGTAWMLSTCMGTVRVHDHDGKLDAKGCALAFSFARGANPSAVKFDEMFDDGEAKSQAAVQAGGGCVPLAKAFEEMRQEIGLDPLAVIDDAHFHMAVHALHDHLHAPALWRELDG